LETYNGGSEGFAQTIGVHGPLTPCCAP